MTFVAKINSPVVSQSISLKERAQLAWADRKVTVLSSGFSTAAFAGGTAAATLFGGPLFLIVGLAMAALLAFGLMIKSLFSQPAKTATAQPQQIANSANGVPVPVAPTSRTITVAPAIVHPQPIAQPQPTAAATAGATPQAQVNKSLTQTMNDLFSSTTSYVHEHPYQAALGVAVLAAAGYGIYTTTAAKAAPVLALGGPILGLPAPAIAKAAAKAAPAVAKAAPAAAAATKAAPAAVVVALKGGQIATAQNSFPATFDKFMTSNRFAMLNGYKAFPLPIKPIEPMELPTTPANTTVAAKPKLSASEAQAQQVIAQEIPVFKSTPVVAQTPAVSQPSYLTQFKNWLSGYNAASAPAPMKAPVTKTAPAPAPTLVGHLVQVDTITMTDTRPTTWYEWFWTGQNKVTSKRSIPVWAQAKAPAPVAPAPAPVVSNPVPAPKVATLPASAKEARGAFSMPGTTSAPRPVVVSKNITETAAPVVVAQNTTPSATVQAGPLYQIPHTSKEQLEAMEEARVMEMILKTLRQPPVVHVIPNPVDNSSAMVVSTNTAPVVNASAAVSVNTTSPVHSYLTSLVMGQSKAPVAVKAPVISSEEMFIRQERLGA
jgi:hypothetical protein